MVARSSKSIPSAVAPRASAAAKGGSPWEKIENALGQALLTLEREGTPVHVLIAADIKRDPVRALSALSRLRPQKASGAEGLNAATEFVRAMRDMAAERQRRQTVSVVDAIAEKQE